MADALTNYQLIYLGYSTVPEYTRYYDQYPDLLGPKGDLKDVQRPWALEAVQEYLPKGAKIIDMGGSSCELASCLMNDYQVAVVDPYDDRGGKPSRMWNLRRKYPHITFIRDVLNSYTGIQQDYQAVVSTGVIKHIRPAEVFDALVGIDKALVVGGYSIHAIDFTVRGEGRIKTLTDQIITKFIEGYGLEKNLDDIRQDMIGDHLTYYLSPLMYQQWRGKRRYEEYPWRQVGTVNVILQKTA